MSEAAAINSIPYVIPRITVEVISAVACFVLLKFMIKPYEVTRERRYLGLPLGFSFLGISYVLSSVTYTQLFNAEILWESQLLFRAFPFVFLALTYYSSKKRTKSTVIIWNIALSGFFICLIAAVLLIFIAPQIPQNNYVILNFFVRTLSLICISYIFIYCINEQTREQDPYAKWVVVGYALLGLSQYSVLVWIVDLSYFAFWGSLISRLVGLSAFLIVAYKIFYKPKKKVA